MPEGSSKQTARNDSGEIATSTLAEIYAQQGLLGRALSIYRRMLARAPEDVGIADRIRSLEVRMAEAGPEPQADPPAMAAAGRERLPWDPPEIEAPEASPAQAPAPAQALAPADAPALAQAPAAAEGTPAAEARPAPHDGDAAPKAEPPRANAGSPRRPGRMDAEAFRTWLDGR
jgi:hypothetical protein